MNDGSCNKQGTLKFETLLAFPTSFLLSAEKNYRFFPVLAAVAMADDPKRQRVSKAWYVAICNRYRSNYSKHVCSEQCRKKKIKCDGKSPLCGNCIALKIECTYKQSTRKVQYLEYATTMYITCTYLSREGRRKDTSKQ